MWAVIEDEPLCRTAPYTVTATKAGRYTIPAHEHAAIQVTYRFEGCLPEEIDGHDADDDPAHRPIWDDLSRSRIVGSAAH
jgi:hypothetical protein